MTTDGQAGFVMLKKGLRENVEIFFCGVLPRVKRRGNICTFSADMIK